MIYYVDDFLPEDQFLALKKKVEAKYEPIKPRELFTNYDFRQEPDKFILPIARTGNWMDSVSCTECICFTKMEDTMKSLNIKELMNWSSWFQYSVDTMSLPYTEIKQLERVYLKIHILLSYTQVIGNLTGEESLLLVSLYLTDQVAKYNHSQTLVILLNLNQIV